MVGIHKVPARFEELAGHLVVLGLHEEVDEEGHEVGGEKLLRVKVGGLKF